MRQRIISIPEEARSSIVTKWTRTSAICFHGQILIFSLKHSSMIVEWENAGFSHLRSNRFQEHSRRETIHYHKILGCTPPPPTHPPQHPSKQSDLMLGLWKGMEERSIFSANWQLFLYVEKVYSWSGNWDSPRFSSAQPFECRVTGEAVRYREDGDRREAQSCLCERHVLTE